LARKVGAGRKVAQAQEEIVAEAGEVTNSTSLVGMMQIPV